MRVVCTGQSGVAKLNYLSQVKELLKTLSPPQDLEIYSVGERMAKEYEKAFKKKSDIDRILDLPFVQLSLLRRSVLKDIIHESRSHKNCILDTHAVFRWRWGLFPAFDVDQIEEFDPDFFVTLIDDVDEIHERLRGKRWSGFSLKDIMVWREEEILATDMIAKLVSEKKRKEVPNYILARGHHPSVLQKLISQNDLRKIYLSFGITGLTQPEKEEVRKFRQRMSELFIAFDPYKIEERGLKITKETVEDELNGLLEDKTHAFNDCFDQCGKEFEKAAQGKATVWKAPSRQAIKESLIRSVNITFKKRRNEREDELSTKEVSRTFSFSDIGEIGHDIDGQIILRDFRLIDQSDMILAFIGLDEDERPIISAGSQTEIKYASETRREVFVICRAKDKLSPWVIEMVTDGEKGAFPDIESAVSDFRSRGYIN